MMQARDATGRQVSLLNDDHYAQQQQHYAYSTPSQFHSDRSPLPPTPELLRSDSYDSNASYDALSPLTPGVYDYSPRPVYDDYCPLEKSVAQRPGYFEHSRATSYDDDSGNSGAAPERATKRYPCRYRDTHGCEKTFTTSGHASRHSKIHTAEKAVQCTYQGCHKKFTRADNMKQHLETHYKDKTRSSSSSKSSKSSLFSSSSKRASISSRSTSSHTSPPSQEVHMWDADHFAPDAQSPSLTGSTWDMNGLNGSLVSRPVAARTSSGLDALAAIACQEGA
ncbi:transcriptional repressor [Diatrype stigma]|uniref:Transcriptional repressor n=1 Tax=Diatrype stigma TaxID=117547 RepID=A0AAN9UYA8_9PEZI